MLRRLRCGSTGVNAGVHQLRAGNPEQAAAPTVTCYDGPAMLTTSSACAQCGRSIGGRLAFQFRSRVGTICKCLSCAVRHVPLLKRSASVALVVGSLLIVVNQGDLLLGGLWTPALAWKIPLTYLVPFLVATYGALGQSRVP